jgi:hypothetical protein
MLVANLDQSRDGSGAVAYLPLATPTIESAHP